MRQQHALEALTRSLLYAEQTLAAHAEVLHAAFQRKPVMSQMVALAGRTLAWTVKRPQPRAAALARQLRQDAAFGRLLVRYPLRPEALSLPPRMRVWLDTEGLPRIETVGELAAWLRVDPGYLFWLADLHDRNRRAPDAALRHYQCEIVSKRDGSARLLEAPKQHLKHLQRQILHEILDRSKPHEAAHGFREGRSIVTFALPHAGKQAVLRLDLKDFFPSISGPRVQGLFRTLGYPEHVADLLGGLCTTTTPREVWNAMDDGIDPEERQRLKMLYARPHLPQGAPTSPAIANLCGLRADRRLAAVAEAAGATYTRYADDLAFSGNEKFARSAGRFEVQVAAILHEEGFAVHHRKTKFMRSSVSQRLAGMTVNVKPNLQRKEIDRLKAILINCVRYGPDGQNRDGHADFRAHLEGRVSFVAMVNPVRGTALRGLLERIVWG